MIPPIIRKRGESGNSLFLGTAALIFIVPMMGLSIDASFLYAVKGRLQAAADGASLGAARALNLGSTLTAQQTAAAQNATNWFYANFPPGTWATTNTLMTNSNPSENNSSGFMSSATGCPVTNGCGVYIYPDSTNPQLDHVQVSASTSVPTWFMHWFGMTTNEISVVSNATRRALVAMMVLDRSHSMCYVNGSSVTGNNPCGESNTTTPCYALIEAAKLFTGQFAEGRDYIGMISFAHNAYVHTAPTQSFQSTLGYTSSFGSGMGQIDNLVCDGGTGTAQAMSMGYQLLYQTGLPGALNVLLLETDGLPNTLTMNFYDSTNNVVGLVPTSNCQDSAGHSMASGKFNTANIPSWTSGQSLNSAPFLSTASPFSFTSIPKGMVGAVPSSDPGGGNVFWMMDQYFTTSTANDYDTNGATGGDYITLANGCNFNAANNTTVGYYGGNPPDLKWWPPTDVMGNSVNPTNAYQSFSGASPFDASGHVLVSGGWTNYHAAVLNATDNSAYVARANATNPAYVFTVGLGGNSTNGPPDPILLQRMANDPNGDLYNTDGPEPGGGYYLPCAQESTCINYSSQYKGTFIYAPTFSQLAQAFIKISSEILSLAK